MREAQFIQSALNELADVWNSNNVNHLASVSVPDLLLGRRRGLLKGDINRQWARWFVESIADPRRVVLQRLTYAHLFEEVLKAVERHFSAHERTLPESQELASAAARIVFHMSQTIKAQRSRRPITFNQRQLLLDLAGSPPRCWICGSEFTERSIEQFLFGRQESLDLPPFVDVFKPRGLLERDLRIEVDHVVPFSHGGAESENLSLACGWCNRHKSAHLSIYDVEGQPRATGENKLGLSSLPQPFWVVRLLAHIRRCEHAAGCNRTSANTELTVVAIREGGALNLANLRATCSEHDSFRLKRLQVPSVVRKIWRLD